MTPLLLIVLFILHDGEEVLYLPGWVKQNSAVFDVIQVRYPITRKILPLLLSSNQKQFSMSVLLLLVLISIISTLAVIFPRDVRIQGVFIGAIILYTLHLFVHFAQSLFLRCIIPGTITSLIILIPSALLWLYQLNVMNITFQHSLLLGLIGLAILIPAFPLVMKFGRWAVKTA